MVFLLTAGVEVVWLGQGEGSHALRWTLISGGVSRTPPSSPRTIQKPAAYLKSAFPWGPTTVITDISFILGAGKTCCPPLGKRVWFALQIWNHKMFAS